MSYELDACLQAESGCYGGQYGDYDFQDFSPDVVHRFKNLDDCRGIPCGCPEYIHVGYSLHVGAGLACPEYIHVDVYVGVYGHPQEVPLR